MHVRDCHLHHCGFLQEEDGGRFEGEDEIQMGGAIIVEVSVTLGINFTSFKVHQMPLLIVHVN